MNISSGFDDCYPAIGWFVTNAIGWIELGYDDYSRSMIRVLDPGGMLWEGKASFESIDIAMQEAEDFLRKFRTEQRL